MSYRIAWKKLCGSGFADELNLEQKEADPLEPVNRPKIRSCSQPYAF